MAARLVRYGFNDYTLFNGIHGWANEIEVFGSTGCVLNLQASHNGAELVLDFDLHAGPEAVTWKNSVNVMGNWFPLWQTAIPANTPYQNSVSFPFPNFGNVAVFTELVTPQDGIICADLELVNTGMAAANREMPRIETVTPELLRLPVGE